MSVKGKGDPPHAADDALAGLVEYAVQSIPVRLSARDTDVIRAVLRSCLENDPVTRKLVENVAVSERARRTSSTAQPGRKRS